MPQVARMDNGERLCAACAVAAEKEYMQRMGRTTLYMYKGYITNFSGDLKYPILRTKKSIAIVFGRYSTLRFDAWFIDENKALWHCVNVGDNEIAHCKRLQRKPLW